MKQLEITQVTQAKGSGEASHQKEEIMTGMMTEEEEGMSVLEWVGGPMDPSRMSICLRYKPRPVCTDRQDASIRAS